MGSKDRLKQKYHAWTVGITQSGKTTTAIKWLSQQRGLKLFINTKRQPGWSKNCHVTIRDCKKEDIKLLYDNYADFSDKLVEIQFSRESRKKDFLAISDYIMSRHEQNYNLRTFMLIDEIHLYQSNQNLPRQIEELFVMGKGMGVLCNAVAQVPKQINWIVKSNSETVIMHMLDPHNLQYMKQYGIIPESMDPKFPGHRAYIQPYKKKGWSVLQN